MKPANLPYCQEGYLLLSLAYSASRAGTALMVLAA